MAEVRRYELESCPNCGGLLLGEEHADPDGTPRGWFCMECDEREFEPRTVTVIDRRDVEPLVEAARSVLGQRRALATGSYLPDTGVVRAKLDALNAALAPFDRSNLDPPESGASGPENLRIPKDDAPDQPSGER